MNRRTILLAALFASLALNVFIVGAFVGSRLGDEARERPDFRPRNAVATAVRTLSPEHQAAWRDQALEFARENGPRIREARRLARRTMRDFGAEPFDPEAANAGLRRARTLEHQSRVAMDEQLVAFVATLPRDERKRFGEALARAPMAPLRRRGPGDGDGAGLPDR